jgi:hypothetical protein
MAAREVLFGGEWEGEERDGGFEGEIGDEAIAKEVFPERVWARDEADDVGEVIGDVVVDGFDPVVGGGLGEDWAGPACGGGGGEGGIAEGVDVLGGGFGEMEDVEGWVERGEEGGESGGFGGELGEIRAEDGGVEAVVACVSGDGDDGDAGGGVEETRGDAAEDLAGDRASAAETDDDGVGSLALGGGGDTGGLVIGGIDDDGGVEVRAAGEAEGFDVALSVGFGLGDEEVVDGVAVGFEGGAVGTGEDDGVVEGEGGAGVFG